MKKLLLLIALSCNLLSAVAFRIEYGNNITITQPVMEDLYIAGGTITINAPVYGDLIIAGGTIVINDTVTNDILLAGGNVTFNGFVGDDIRCAGGNIRITKDVTGDVVLAGGTVIIEKGVTIGGMVASGGDLTVNGNVQGEIKGAFGDFILNGNVSKGIDCRGGSITINGAIGGKAILAARHLKVSNNATFKGDVQYWNKEGTFDFKQSIHNQKAVYGPSLRIQSGEWYYLGAATILGLLWYLGMAGLMIMLVQYLFSATMQRAANTVFVFSLKSLAIGFLFFIILPIAAIVAFVTIIGVPVAILLLLGYIILVLLSTVITSVVAANWVNNRNNFNWNYWRIVFLSLGIFILMKLVTVTPFIGWLMMILLVCMAFGGILLNVKWQSRQATTVLNQTD
jgi:Polymer-forming cytoskeletal